ncbi:MAG: UDP-N-acetylmuramoyl-L-alanine--D-glutamate ligase, partial [Parvibaculales bacterium]
PEPHPVVALAKSQGLSIIGDMELFQMALGSKRDTIIAITGTNGKSTTTALCAHLLSSMGKKVQMGGNIGVPVLGLAPPCGEYVYVLEISSFQSELAPHFAPHISALLNITPDHIDRHGSFENYVAAKKNILTKTKEHLIIGMGGREEEKLAKLYARKNISLTHIVIGGEGDIAVRDGVLYEGGVAEGSLGGIATLQGAHNWQNAACAYAICRKLGCEGGEIMKAFHSFAGLAHRMQPVGRIGHILCVNDSKATNAAASAPALSAFSDIFWIAGGRAKAGGIDALLPLPENVKAAYFIGEAEQGFADSLAKHGAPPHRVCGTLEGAFEAALRDARSSGLASPVILFSPAAASFDQFEGFEARGDAFIALMEQAEKEGL